MGPNLELPQAQTAYKIHLIPDKFNSNYTLTRNVAEYSVQNTSH